MPLRKSRKMKSRSPCRYGRKKSARRGCKSRPGPKRRSRKMRSRRRSMKKTSRCRYGRKKSMRRGCKSRPGPKRRSVRRSRRRRSVRRSRQGAGKGQLFSHLPFVFLAVSLSPHLCQTRLALFFLPKSRKKETNKNNINPTNFDKQNDERKHNTPFLFTKVRALFY